MQYGVAIPPCETAVPVAAVREVIFPEITVPAGLWSGRLWKMTVGHCACRKGDGVAVVGTPFCWRERYGST